MGVMVTSGVGVSLAVAVADIDGGGVTSGVGVGFPPAQAASKNSSVVPKPATLTSVSRLLDDLGLGCVSTFVVLEGPKTASTASFVVINGPIGSGVSSVATGFNKSPNSPSNCGTADWFRSCHALALSRGLAV